jgi:hypothetical protein
MIRLWSFVDKSEDESVVTVCFVGRRSRGNHKRNTCELGALRIYARFPKCSSNVYWGSNFVNVQVFVICMSDKSLISRPFFPPESRKLPAPFG